MSMINDWVRNNITGSGPRDYVPKDKRADEISKDLDRIEDGFRKADADLDKIDEMSQLKTPKLSDFKDSELVIMGAAGGAVAGGITGMADAVITTFSDEATIDVKTTEYDIMRPEVKGFHGPTGTNRYDADGILVGCDYKYEPDIENKKVGSYEVKEGSVVHSTDKADAVNRGLGHALGGALVGGAIGLGIAVGRKLLHKGEFVKTDERDRKLEGEGKLIAASAGIGAVGGAGLAGLGVLADLSKVDTKDISYDKPIMEEQVIGQIPKDYFNSALDPANSSPGNRDVIANGPKMKDRLIFGDKPVMEKVEQSVSIEPRLNMAKQLAGGALLGGAFGALTGVILNVIRKVI